MPTPYDSADAQLLEEIISQGEKRLQAQLELAKAADQRAMTFAGLLFAGVAVLVALGFSEHSDPNYKPPLLCVAIGFLISAALAGWSARPADWDIVGNVPDNYLDDIADGLTFAETRPITAVHLQDMISKNAVVLRANAKCMVGSMAVAFIFALAGVLSAVV